jgi:hypothetical protein
MSTREILCIIAVVLAVGPVLWIAFVRRELFDPRVHVLGGLIHWVLVSQIITTFRVAEEQFDFDPYEASYGLSEDSYLFIDGMIILAIVSFLIGYALYRPSETAAPMPAPPLATRKLIRRSCMAGYLGMTVLFIFELNPGLPIEPVLLLNYLLPASSIVALYLLLSRPAQNWQPGGIGFWTKPLLAMLPLVTILRSNIALLYPLMALLFYASNRRSRLEKKTTYRLLALLPAFVPAALFTQACVKAYNNLEPLMGLPLTELVMSLQYRDYLWKNILTFDVFNAESYTLLVHLYELYAKPGEYKWGVTLLAAFPVTKLLWRDEIKGLGRRFILDRYGVDAKWETALAVSPIGEMIVNFTFLGVVVFYALLGLLCAYVYSRVRASNSYLLFLVYPVFLGWLFIQQRGDFLNGNMYPGYVFLVASLLFRSALGRTLPEAQSAVRQAATRLSAGVRRLGS